MYPVHSPEFDENEDDEPFVRSERAAHPEDEDDKPLVQPSSRKEPVKEKRGSAEERRTPAHLLKRKGPPQSGETHWPHWTKMCQGIRMIDQKKSEPLRKVINKLLDERNLRDFHLKHYHMSFSQLKNRTTCFACGEDMRIL